MTTTAKAKTVNTSVKNIEPLLNTNDVCAILGITRKTFYLMIGELPVFKVGKGYRCKQSDLNEYINKLKSMQS